MLSSACGGSQDVLLKPGVWGHLNHHLCRQPHSCLGRSRVTAHPMCQLVPGWDRWKLLDGPESPCGAAGVTSLGASLLSPPDNSQAVRALCVGALCTARPRLISAAAPGHGLLLWGSLSRVPVWEPRRPALGLEVSGREGDSQGSAS